MYKKLIYVSAVCALALGTSSAALAKKKPSAASEQVQSPLNSLYTCSAIESAAERLACYDGAVSSLRTAEAKKEIVAIDAKVAKKIKREAFGFNLPSLPKLGLPSIGPEDKPKALVMGVKSVRNNGRKYIVVLDNGQVWEQTNGRINYVPKGKLTATIKPKSMGTFMISLNNGKTTVRGMRVRRVE